MKRFNTDSYFENLQKFNKKVPEIIQICSGLNNMYVEKHNEILQLTYQLDKDMELFQKISKSFNEIQEFLLQLGDDLREKEGYISTIRDQDDEDYKRTMEDFNNKKQTLMLSAEELEFLDEAMRQYKEDIKDSRSKMSYRFREEMDPPEGDLQEYFIGFINSKESIRLRLMKNGFLQISLIFNDQDLYVVNFTITEPSPTTVTKENTEMVIVLHAQKKIDNVIEVIGESKLSEEDQTMQLERFKKEIGLN
jgi:uncharacterized membrane protein (UPF0127 family)